MKALGASVCHGGRWTWITTAMAVILTTYLRARHAAVPVTQDIYNGFDFRLSIWNPGRGLVEGFSVYDPRDRAYVEAYGFDVPAALYAPEVLLLLAPLIALPLRVALVVNAVLTALLFWLCLWLLVRPSSSRQRLTTVAAGLLAFLTQSVDSTFGLGQATALLLLGTALVVRPPVRFASFWSAFGVALLWVKPQTALPLLVVLLIMKRWRDVLTGTLLALALSLPAAILAVVNAGGLEPFVTGLARNVKALAKLPSNSGPTSLRIDLLGRLDAEGIELSTASRVGAVFVLTVLAVLAARACAELVPVALLTWATLLTYHQFYDVAIIVFLAAALVVSGPEVAVRPIGLLVLVVQIAARQGVTSRLADALAVEPPTRSLINTALLLGLLTVVAISGAAKARKARSMATS